MRRAALALAALALVGCDPIAHKSDIDAIRNSAADGGAMERRLTDLYERVEHADEVNRQQADLLQRVTETNLRQQRQLEEISRAYNAHLDWHNSAAR